MKVISGLIVLCLSFGLSFANAKNGAGREGMKDKGPCAEIKCEKGDKFCYEKKKECISKAHLKKLDDAKKNGIAAEAKDKWVAKLERKLANKKERLTKLQSEIPNIESQLNEVKALKTK